VKRSNEKQFVTMGSSLQRQLDFIHVTPAPIFAGFNGFHNGMSGLVKVLGGVFVFRTVAAAHVTTLQTEAQMHPGVSHFEAFFATVCVRGYGANLIEVFAVGHDSSEE
jgi:hypothetical protein